MLALDNNCGPALALHGFLQELIMNPSEFFVFKTVTKSQTEELYKLASQAQLRASLKGLFQTQLHEDVLADFHFNNFQYCKRHNFTLEQTSTLLGIFQHVFSLVTEARAAKDHVQQVLASLLQKHSLQRAPFSISVFSAAEVYDIQCFAQATLFKHFELYEFAFTPQHDIVLTTAHKFAAAMPFSLPLTTDDQVDPSSVEALAEYIREPSVLPEGESVHLSGESTAQWTL